MKSFVPWFYLVAAASSPAIAAIDGLDAYRQGNYPLAAQALNDQAGKDPIADYYMGRMRLYGYGQLKNNSLAQRHFNQAGERGVLAAQQLLARYNLVETKDYEKALYWFKKAAAAGDTEAQMYCAAAYLFGLGTKENSDTARKYYIDAARSGNTIAQIALANQFLESRDQRNKKLGAIWLNKAAEQGDVNAQAQLGAMYATGSVVSADPAKAIDLLSKAAAKNSIPAMVALGELAIKQKEIQTGKDWLMKAAAGDNAKAKMALAQAFMDSKSELYDPKSGFMWMLKAAQSGSAEAQQELSLMYKEGKGVAANPQLAEQWQAKSKETAEKQDHGIPALVQAARWLSNNKSDSFVGSKLYLGGIYTDWKNPMALKGNNYNEAPQLEAVTRSDLYKPDFVMADPKKVAINDYFDLIAPTLNTEKKDSWSFPRYPLDQEIEAMQKKQAMNKSGDTVEAKEINEGFKEALDRLYGQAILGESAAQFEIAQLYQYGIAVAKNTQQALVYFELAAAQQDVRAEYNIGILYLEGQITPVDYQQGIDWLTDAAFKGNVMAQYALANIYDKGFKNPAGEEVIAADSQKAMSMYYLASANNYGPAEYQLAEYLVKQKQNGLSMLAKQNREKLIRRLYQGAVDQGVSQARLPLAFYNAMDSNPEKQRQAFDVARQEAKAGNSQAALLLGMMIERGISVPANEIEALYWYQQAAMSPVNAFILGTYYSQGTNLNKDLDKGRALLQQAADAGFSYANLNLAVLKEQGRENFIPELDKARIAGNSTAGLLLADYYLAQADDPDKMQQAREIYQYFAEKGDKNAELKLAYLHDKGLGGSVDREAAEKWYLMAAEQGQPIAQYMLGRLYQLGRNGGQPDYDAAKKWYASAESNYTRAAVALGFIYDTVDDNYAKAMENYQLAANKGDAIGQFNLGLLYDNGKGIPVDFEKAKKLYTDAADQGHSQAMTQLATMYFSGIGVDRNELKSLQYYKKAAALGDANALYQLGLLSETGVATQINFANALNYYQQSAAKGNEKAKLALARMYQYGLGVKKDEEQATRLYNELAANDNAYAQYQLALIKLKTAGDYKPEEAKRLLQRSSANGSQEAGRLLQRIDAEHQDKLSFIEPAQIDKLPELVAHAPDLLYMDALSQWNSGDEVLSRQILNQVLAKFPDYAPARQAYERINQHTDLVSAK